MDSCLFCKIIQRAIPADIVYEDNATLAFKDIRPQAPHHYLIIPKAHLKSLNDISADNRAGVAQLLEVAARVASEQGIAETGYRCVVNNGRHAGQEVDHLHLHLLAGRPLTWPPG